MIRLTILSALLLLFVARAASLPWNNDNPLAGYTKRTWQAQDGLPEQIVQAFAQTSDRYLWIGTTGGLLRFDGARFLLYDRENTPALSENNVFCLMVSRDDSLWIGTEGGGLLRYRSNSFRSFSAKDGLTNGFVRIVYQDSRGQVWIGTDNGLFRLSNERIERVDNSSAIPAVAVHAIHEDRRGRLWVGGSRLLALQGNTATEYHLEGEASQNRVKSILGTSDGTLWVGTVSGLQKMDLNSTSGNSSFSRIKEINGTVRSLRETSDGTLWIGMIGHGIYVYRGRRFTKITAPGILPSNTVLNLFEDMERNIWVGTQVGMLRLSKTPVRTAELPDAADSDFGTIYADRSGDLWVAATHLFRFQNGKAARYQFPGLGGVRIRNVFRDSSGTLWIGTDGKGVFRWNGSQLVQYTTRQHLVNNFIRAFLQGRDGSLWIATDEGVSHWRSQGFTNYQMRDGLCYFSTRALLEDRNGDLWIGTDRGVSRLHGGAFATDEATEALKDEKIWAIHEDADGDLWFGTRTGGLYRRRLGKMTHYTVAQGLASNSIYEILEDVSGNLWMSGPSGISVLNRHELDESVEPSRPIALTLYSISDGMETTQIYGGEKPAGVLTAQGEVWFPSNKGPISVSLEKAKTKTKDGATDRAPAVIYQVLADGRELPALPSIPLGPDNAKLEIHYGVVLLRSQERVRFRYILQGFDKNWTEASSQRVAYYTNLPPGRYQFRVAAFEMDSPEEISQTSIEIVQKPHLYRTSWFLFCVLLVLATLVWGIYQLRLRQLRGRLQAVLNERSRLAREMHDTLIQGCVSVSALLEAHSSIEGSGSDASQDLLNCARTQLRSTADEARRAVWDLRHGPDSVTGIDSMLRRMKEQVGREFGVPIECQVLGRPFALNQLTAHELLMIVREALYNSVRHGHPHQVQLQARFEKNRLVVQVRDDGCGFDSENVSSPSATHYGLIGMRERVHRLGGKFALNSRTGKGTELVIQISRKASLAQDVDERAVEGDL